MVPAATFDDTLLDDADRLLAADTGQALRAAATAGAQVRSTALAAAEAGLDRFAGDRPRALVLVNRPGVTPAAAPLLAALLGNGCPVPVVTADAVPSWVGALDVVLAHAVDPADRELAAGVDRAMRRGTRMLLTAPPNGPLAAAAAGAAVLVEPRIDVAVELALPRAVAAGLALLDVLGLLRVDLDRMADELDREAERCRPDTESFVNPAKSLALRLAEHTPLLWGTDPVAAAVAGHGATAFAAQAGVVAHGAGFVEAMALPALRTEAFGANTSDDVFHDPFDDLGAAPGYAVRPVLVSVRPDDPLTGSHRTAARSALPSAEHLDVDDDLGDPGDGAPADRDAVAAAVLALRLDLAALYLGLARGVQGGPDRMRSAV